MTKTENQRRYFSPEFKRDAVQWVQQGDKPLAAVARTLRVTAAMLLGMDHHLTCRRRALAATPSCTALQIIVGAVSSPRCSMVRPIISPVGGAPSRRSRILFGVAHDYGCGSYDPTILLK